MVSWTRALETMWLCFALVVFETYGWLFVLRLHEGLAPCTYLTPDPALSEIMSNTRYCPGTELLQTSGLSELLDDAIQRTSGTSRRDAK